MAKQRRYSARVVKGTLGRLGSSPRARRAAAVEVDDSEARAERLSEVLREHGRRLDALEAELAAARAAIKALQ